MTNQLDSVQLNSLELINGGTIKNFKVETLIDESTITESGKMWFSDTEKTWKYSTIDSTGKVIIKYLDSTTNKTEEVLPLGWKIITKTLSYNNQYIDGPIWINLDEHHGNFSFQSKKNKGIFENFIMPFDCASGTRVYPTIHWAPASASTGNVIWQLDYNVSKGYGQGSTLSSAPTSFIISAPGKGVIAESQTTICLDNQAFLAPEPNSVVSLKLSRMGEYPADTFIGDIYVVAISLMYQSNHETTLNKKPNFYK